MSLTLNGDIAIATVDFCLPYSKRFTVIAFILSELVCLEYACAACSKARRRS